VCRGELTLWEEVVARTAWGPVQLGALIVGWSYYCTHHRELIHASYVASDLWYDGCLRFEGGLVPAKNVAVRDSQVFR
jgi:hypothetical protein